MKSTGLVLFCNGIIVVLPCIVFQGLSETINSNVCGQSRPSGRIEYGHKTSKEDIPWIVHQVSNFKTDVPITCGGSIIAPSYVLTAASCVYLRTKGEKAYKVHVYYNSSKVDKGPRAEVDYIRVHPAFRRQKEGKHGYDIAVLKLNIPLDFDNHVSPVCLPVKKTNFLGIPLQIAGWGSWEHGDHSEDLRSEMTRGMEYVDCGSIIDFRKIGVNESLIICSHMEGGQTCFGDSGGPLTGIGPEGRSVLLGVTVYGTPCNEYLGFALFTKVHFFVPWIKKEIRILDKKPPKNKTPRPC